jgi:hypothetical protein
MRDSLVRVKQIYCLHCDCIFTELRFFQLRQLVQCDHRGLQNTLYLIVQFSTEFFCFILDSFLKLLPAVHSHVRDCFMFYPKCFNASSKDVL